MGAALPLAEALAPRRAPEGVVFGPQVGAPVTALAVVEAGRCRGDILVGTADGTLLMFTLRPRLLISPSDPAVSDRGFRAQPALPQTDGARHYCTAHAVLPLVFDGNVHAIKGAYCDGRRVYTNIGVAGRSQGARVVVLPEPRAIASASREAMAASDEEGKQHAAVVGGDGDGDDADVEAYGRRALDYDQFPFVDLRETFALRSSTHILQHKTEVICLTAERDGASVHCKTGQEYDIPQSYHDGDSIVGLDVRKRDVPTFFDGKRLVFMTTRGSVDNPRSKTRTVTVYGGWGGPYGRREQRRRARRRARRRKKRQKRAAEEGTGRVVAADGTKADDVQVYVHSPNRKTADAKSRDNNDKNMRMDEAEEEAEDDDDDDEVDMTRDLYVLAQFKWVMPERRVVWGFDLSDTQMVSIHDDTVAMLWDLVDREHQSPLGEAAMENGPAMVLRHSSRIHGYDFTQSGDLVSVCDGGVVYLWRDGFLFTK
jgi:hypothetical protein